MNDGRLEAFGLLFLNIAVSNNDNQIADTPLACGGTIETDDIAALCWISVDDIPVISNTEPELVTVYVHGSKELPVTPQNGGQE